MTRIPGVPVRRRAGTHLLGLLFIFVGLPLGLNLVAHAQDISQTPVCAQSCIVQQTTTCGSLTDISCVCKDSTFVSGVTACLISSCSASDLASSQNFFNQLCSSAGVSIPGGLGASSSSSPPPDTLSSQQQIVTGSASTTPSIPQPNASSASEPNSSSASERNASSASEPANSAPGGSGGGASGTQATATFTRGSLLVGTCTSPRFMIAAAVAVTATVYPQVGCAGDNPGCCPASTDGGVRSCPDDYTTTSSVCCPAGWSLYSATLDGQTPCYSTLLVPLPSPTAASLAASSTQTEVIVNQVFARSFPLSPPEKSGPGGLSDTAKLGIGLGVGLGVCVIIIAILAWFLLRRRRKNEDELPQPPIAEMGGGDGKFRPEMEGGGVQVQQGHPGAHELGGAASNAYPYQKQELESPNAAFHQAAPHELGSTNNPYHETQVAGPYQYQTAQPPRAELQS